MGNDLAETLCRSHCDPSLPFYTAQPMLIPLIDVASRYLSLSRIIEGDVIGSGERKPETQSEKRIERGTTDRPPLIFVPL